MLVHALLSQLNTGEERRLYLWNVFCRLCPMYLEKHTVIALAKLYIVIWHHPHLYTIEHLEPP